MSLLNALQFRVGLDTSSASAGLAKFRSQASSMIGAAVGVGMAALTASVGAFAKGAIDAGAEAEAFESRLSSLMGSSSEARDRLSDLYEFAASTPYNTSEIVAAEVTMRGFGAAAQELMPGLIDFAALTGTELPQAARDFGKAWQIGATGLESDGGRLLRAQIELRTGLDASKMAIEDFRAAMLETLDDGMFQGGAERLSRTFTGMVSNLVDEWDRFKRQVADAGVFDRIKGALSVTLDLIAQNRDITTEWASVASDVLWGSFQAVGYVIAGIADTLSGVRLAALLVANGALNIAGGFVAAAQAAVRLDVLTGRMAGNTAMVDKALGNLTRLGEVQANIGGMRDEVEGALNASASGSTATQRWADFVNQAELAAGGFADELERAADTPPAAPPVEGEGDSYAGGWEALIQKQEEASAMLAEFAALNTTEAQRIEQLYTQRVDAITAAASEELITAQEAADARLQVDTAYHEARSALEAQYIATINANHEAQLRMTEEERQAKIAAAQDAANLAVAMLQLITAATDGETREQKAIRKAAAIGQIIIEGAVNLVEAFPNPVAMAASAALTATQLVTVGRQHQGGVIYAHQGRYPDEYDRGGVRRLQQEATLNSQATRALGEQGVLAMNGGAVGGPTVVEFRVGRAVQREVVSESMRPGGPVDRRMSSRERNRRLDVGFTGLAAV